jgi:hypothetical protein
MLKFHELLNTYKDKDVFIIGNGPELNFIDDSLKQKIRNNYITIGCNFTHLFLEETDFYLSGHWCPMLYNIHYGKVKNTRLFQGPTIDFDYDSNKILNVENINVQTNMQNFILPDSDSQYLVGSENILFSCFHLAYILGFKRIFTIGVSMKSNKHYYDDEYLLNEMKTEWDFLYSKYKSNRIIDVDFQNIWNLNLSGISNDISILTTDGNIHKRTEYFENMSRILNNLSDIFELLRSLDRDVYCFNPDSIIYDAGAKLINYNSI